ncbi:hypothetical protein RN001_010269 [Aquatica leii]|uniref:Selenocysteine-specific elongation factor n=1 Tax=Aquatica leii TaxID=1421715 RepID=A0AAN7P7N9_9COLE|nr:hypothetical protein RN001_010269 [Aquatica leii]
MLNLNIGILGHVDSGKTTLAKALSQVASTAAFDKNPQSKERGITLDLGFSSFTVSTPEHLKTKESSEEIQFTLVDCPGHASLLRTIIGGAQIIDFILLVIDITKGIQTQTAECIVIGEITCKHLIVILNKIDLIEESVRARQIEKMTKHLKKSLSSTNFADSSIVAISAHTKAEESIGISDLITKITELAFYPKRFNDRPFVLAVDHCFSIKGKGTILTGTILQGSIKVGDEIELPSINTIKMVKSIQMFRQSVSSGSAGDRIGVRVTQFDSKLMERGIACKLGYAYYIYCGIMSVNKIKYFKGDISSKSKFHITIGYETVLATVTCFSCENDNFDIADQFKYLDKLRDVEETGIKEYLLLEFEKPVLVLENTKLIGSKLDVDKYSHNCRLAFWGCLLSNCRDKDFKQNYLSKVKIYKEKSKVGKIDQILNEHLIIVKNLVKKETNLECYKDLEVTLSTGEKGIIQGTFGKSGKVKVCMNDGLIHCEKKNTESNNVTVTLFLFNFFYKLSEDSVIMTRRIIWQLSTRLYSTDRSFSTAIFPSLLEDYQEETIHDAVPKPYSEIPGPKKLPIIGNTWRFAPVIGQYKITELDKLMWALWKNYGKIVKVGGLIGHPDLLFVFDGDEIKKVFRREEDMPRRPSMPSLHYYKEILQKEFFDGNAGVIGIHGPKWDEFRRQVQQIVLPPSTAKKYIQPLNTIAGEFLQKMEESLNENQELPDNFLYEIYKWALESVARVSLDTRLGCLDANLDKNSESQNIINSINTFFWNVAEVELKMPIWKIYQNKAFKKYIAALEDFRILCMKHITKTLEDTSKLQHKKEEDISIVERIFEKTGNSKIAAVLALDLMLVGVDTTSIALASTMYQLSQNPDKQQKVFEELQSVLPNPKSDVDNMAQENLHYLKACIKETLRMYPVIIGNGRSLNSDAVIGGYKVPKGTHVIFPHLVVSNIEEYFDKPNEFIPERWLKTEMHSNNCPMKYKKIHPFVTLPFGYGRRACLGRRFAEMELQILLAKIFRKYKVEYNYGPLTYEITPTYVPKEPLKFKLTLR